MFCTNRVTISYLNCIHSNSTLSDLSYYPLLYSDLPKERVVLMKHYCHWWLQTLCTWPHPLQNFINFAVNILVNKFI